MNDVKGLKQGDRSCFENIFNEYSPDLYVVAYRITGNKSTAEDIVQDFFVKLWVNREKLSIYKSFRYYCFSAIHYASLNATRTKYRDTELSEELEDPSCVEYEMERAELSEKIHLQLILCRKNVKQFLWMPASRNVAMLKWRKSMIYR